MSIKSQKIWIKKNKKHLKKYRFEYRKKNIEKIREYDKKWKRKERKNNPQKHKKALQKSYRKLHTKRLKDKKEELLKIKLEVYNAYGGPKCVCCGEKHIEFLSLDHIHDDGASHRRKLFGNSRSGGSLRMYRWLKKNNYPKNIIQILCMNCNVAKHRYGICPHKK